jgi:cyclic pyranopterin phosphate synthase
MIPYTDPHHRTFKNLRVSLTDICNLNCVYCTLGNEEEIIADHRPQQPASFFIDLIDKPLLYRELPQLIKGLQQHHIHEIKMTSNGFLLERKAEELKNAGLKSINISLDALDENVFYQITKRSKVDNVINGIDAAINCGMEVKLNAVIMKDLNESEILPLLDFAFKRNIPLRFLEVMAMGHLYNGVEDHFVSQQHILDIISTQYQFSSLPRRSSATANYWETSDGQTFGIIANESAPFCKDCNRLRLDAKGNIYGCLSDNNPIDIVGQDSSTLTNSIQQAMQQKQLYKFVGSELSMLQIGG